jgi:hypothetical protein
MGKRCDGEGGRVEVALGVCARDGWEDSQDVLCRVEVGASGQELR